MLVGDVNREDSVSLASNKTPGTKEEILRVRTKDKLTADYDFCFSVPKSVSIYLADVGVNRSSDNQFPLGICPRHHRRAFRLALSNYPSLKRRS